MANDPIKEIRYQVGEAWKGEYNSNYPYGVAAVVQDPTGLSVYRSLKDGNTGHPLTDSNWWFKIIDMSSIKAASDNIDALNTRIELDESARVLAEQGRVDAESGRVSAESGRVTAESGRVSAESSRVSAESGRATAETNRGTAESGRVSAESGRVTAEAGRVNAESLRNTAEGERATAENNRVAAESERHTQYTTDHGNATSDHSTYVSDHATAAADHTTATNDHTASTEATAKANNVNATIDGMIVTITDKNGVSTSVDIGFDIYKTYASVAAMNADAANVAEGKFVMIATTDTTSVENARLYVRNENAASSETPFTFLCDLDQAASSAWADWFNNYKPTIESDHTRAENDHTQASTDHGTAASDHTQAGTDHTTAASDHTLAASDHTTASSDHTTAGTDHTTAAADHTQAESDHTRAETDHASIADKVSQAELEEALENFVRKGSYDASTSVGMSDQLRGSVYADEQFAVRMTGGEANEVGNIGVVQQLKGAGAAIVQMFPEGANHDFSGDVSLDGTGGNAEAVLRYSDVDGTVEMGYLLAMEAFISQTLTQEQLDAISAKDTGKADRDKAVWLTPAGAITSAPTNESGQTEVTFSGWRIAMRVKASEVRDASASTYWFTSGTKGRQVFDVAVAEGIDDYYPATDRYQLASPWNTKSAMEYLNHMAAQGLPTHSVKAMSALLAVTKMGVKTVKSRNLLNPQTGRALLKAYVNDGETYLDNEYTMLGGLPSGSTMAFTSLLTGKTETLTMLDSTHFVIPSDGWLQITGTLPESIIATWDGTKDNTAADEYATESHTWDVSQLFGTKEGGTEGHYYRFAKEGMRGAGSACDVVELVNAEGVKNLSIVHLKTLSWYPNATSGSFGASGSFAANYTQVLCSQYAKVPGRVSYNAISDKTITIRDAYVGGSIALCNKSCSNTTQLLAALNGVYCVYRLATPLTFTSLFLSASSTSDELTAMPADAIPLSEIQFADCNWSIEEAVYDAPEADANGVIDTIHQVTGQMRIQYSIDAAEQIDTLQKEYQALEARVTALENA